VASSGSQSHKQRFLVEQQHRLFWLAVLFLVAYGLVFGGAYGASIDEPRHVKFGREVLEIYQGQRPIDDTVVSPVQHGPFYSFVAFVAGHWVEDIRPGWTPTDGRHFIYYLSFVAATVFIGLLVSRYTRPAVSWLVAALFFTQPVLLGHAFINPKDVPFMAFFLGALTAGVFVMDHSVSAASPASSHVQPDPDTAPGVTRRTRWLRVLIGWTLTSAAILSALWLWKELLPILQSILADAYRGQAPWAIQTLFNAVATDAYKTPLDLYAGKLTAAFVLIRKATTLILSTITVIGWANAAWLKARSVILAYRPWLLAAGAGILLGLDTSIRAVAPLAALPLFFLYLRYAGAKKRALLYIAVMALAAAAACIISWPYLWQETLQRYWQSIVTLSDFPWNGIILFQGQLLSKGQQPWYYIPELMLLQFTLPLIALALLGLTVCRRWLKDSQARIEITSLLITLAVPIIASFRPGTIVYNNFRQFLFVTPGLFLLAALGLEQIFRWLSGAWWRASLAALALLPGIVGIVRLYPYEYIYYNALAGIGGSTYERFESDYWCTSYRALTDWVNTYAPTNTTLWVGPGGIKTQVSTFSRSDLNVLAMGSSPTSNQPTLAMVCDGKGGVLNAYPGAPVLMTVEREGAILGEVKDLRQRP